MQTRPGRNISLGVTPAVEQLDGADQPVDRLHVIAQRHLRPEAVRQELAFGYEVAHQLHRAMNHV